MLNYKYIPFAAGEHAKKFRQRWNIHFKDENQPQLV